MEINFSLLKLRKANLSDALIVYKWAMDPTVRAYSINSDQFSFTEHLQWFKEKINHSDTLYFILEHHFPLGQIRFDYSKEGWIISFLIDENFRGLGLGFEIVKRGIEASKKNAYIAYVKENNVTSNKIFEKLNFNIIPSDIVHTLKWEKRIIHS